MGNRKDDFKIFIVTVLFAVFSHWVIPVRCTGMDRSVYHQILIDCSVEKSRFKSFQGVNAGP